MNKHHTESNKIIDDKIKGVEASLASKGTGKNPEIVNLQRNNYLLNPYILEILKMAEKGGEIEISEEGIWTYIDWEIPPN